MIDTLVAFGCSHTFGSETIAPGDYYNPDNIYHSYPFYLSQRLNIPNYVNCARPTASNIEICYKVLRYILSKPKNVFILIGWTGDNRFPIFTGKEFKTALSPKKLGKLLNSLQQDKDIFEENRSHTIYELLLTKFFFGTEACNFLNAIIKLFTAMFLQQQNIPFFTVPTIKYEKYPLYSYLSLKNNLLCYNDSGELTFNMKDYKRKTNEPPQGHFTALQHQLIADYVYNEIQQRKTLTVYV